MARLQGRGIPEFKSRLYGAMRIDDVRQASGAVSGMFPADLVRHAKITLKNSTITRTWHERARAEYTDYERLDHQAMEHYYRELAAATGDADAYHKFGYRLMREKRYHEALEIFQQVLVLDAGHNNTHFNMAACYEYLNDLPQALDYYGKEAEVDPDDRDIHYRLGRVYENGALPGGAGPPAEGRGDHGSGCRPPGL